MHADLTSRAPGPRIRTDRAREWRPAGWLTQGGISMFRKATLLSVLASLALLAPMAHAAKGDVKITLGGGAGIPMGDFSKKVADGGAGGSLGFTSGLAVDYMVTS